MDYDFTDLPIPPRGRPALTVDLRDDRVIALFTLGGRKTYPAAAARSVPPLAAFAGHVRSDGTVPAKLAGSLIAVLRRDGGVHFDLTVTPEAQNLSERNPPDDFELSFVFDRPEARLLLLGWSDGRPVKYDGKGVFVLDGRFFQLPAVSMADPFLRDLCYLPASHFKTFFRALLPKLRQGLRVDCGLVYDGRAPVELRVLRGADEKLLLRAEWRAEYGAITLFSDCPGLCEEGGRLFLAGEEALELFPDEWTGNGTFPLSDEAFDLLQRLYGAAPYFFTESDVFFQKAPLHSSFSPLSDAGERILLDFSDKGGALLSAELVRPPSSLQSMSALEFERAAARYSSVRPAPAEYIPFVTYYPTYQVMTARQRAYYFFLRANLGEKNPIKADISYLLLFFYELLSKPENLDLILFVWKSYREQFPRLDHLLPGWVRDYVVLRRLDEPVSSVFSRLGFVLYPPPAHADLFLSRGETEDLSSLPLSRAALLAGYDMAGSVLSRPDRADAFKRGLTEALSFAERYHREKKGGSLAEVFRPEPKSFTVRSFASAMRTAADSFDVTYTYLPFSFNPALRAFLNALFRAAENLLRKKLGVKGKLKEGALEHDFRAALEAHFRGAPPAPSSAPPAPIEIDIGRAAALEAESWSTTVKLLEAAGTLPEEEEEDEPEEPPQPEGGEELDEWARFFARLSEAERAVLRAFAEGRDPESAAAAFFALPEALIEAVNEAAVEETGDIVVEEGALLPEYRAQIEALFGEENA